MLKRFACNHGQLAEQQTCSLMLCGRCATRRRWATPEYRVVVSFALIDAAADPHDMGHKVSSKVLTFVEQKATTAHVQLRLHGLQSVVAAA